MGADRSALTALGVVAVLLVALVATTSGGLGPVSLAHPTAQHHATSGGHDGQDQAGAGSTTHRGEQPSPPRAAQGARWLPTWGRLVLVVVLACGVLTLLAGVRVRVVRRRRSPPRRKGAPTALVEDPTA